MTPQFTTTRRIEFAETDMAGIVHFSCFYRYMEEAEHEYFRNLGLSIMQVQEDDSIIGWPRVSAKCSFEVPVYFEEEIEIRVAVDRKGMKSLTMNYEFYNKDNVRVAYGTMKTVCCHFKRGEKMKSIEIPEPYDGLLVEAEQ